MASGRLAGQWGTSRAAYWIALLALLLSYLAHVYTLRLTFPVPWPDEGSFLWPSIAVQEMNTLLAPQLNPDRPVMWMPPGYMIVQGLIFKVTGFSLELARALSALYLCAAVAMFAALLEKSPARMLHLGLAGVFLHGPILLLAGNTARMEPLVLLMAAGSLLLIWRDNIWPGLALAAVAPLVHPNGAYFALGAAGYVAIRLGQRPGWERHWTRGLIWLSVPALMWALYAVYVFRHWDYFHRDMGFQLSMKQSLNSHAGGILGRALQVRDASPTLLIAGLAFHAVRRRSVLAPLLAFVIPAHVLTVTTRGWMYEVYTALEYFLICAMSVHVVWTAWPASRARFVLDSRALATGASTLALAMLGHHTLRSPAWLGGTVSFAVAPLGDRSTLAYFAPADAKAVRAYLDSLRRPGQEMIVQFHPYADALLFRDAEGSGVGFSQPTFHQSPADVYIVHESRHISRPHRAIIESLLAVQLHLLPLKQWTVIHSRDDTERWLAYRPERAASSSSTRSSLVSPRSSRSFQIGLSCHRCP